MLTNNIIKFNKALEESRFASLPNPVEGYPGSKIVAIKVKTAEIS